MVDIRHSSLSNAYLAVHISKRQDDWSRCWIRTDTWMTWIRRRRRKWWTAAYTNYYATCIINSPPHAATSKCLLQFFDGSLMISGKTEIFWLLHEDSSSKTPPWRADWPVATQIWYDAPKFYVSLSASCDSESVLKVWMTIRVNLSNISTWKVRAKLSSMVDTKILNYVRFHLTHWSSFRQSHPNRFCKYREPGHLFHVVWTTWSRRKLMIPHLLGPAYRFLLRLRTGRTSLWIFYVSSELVWDKVEMR